MTENLYQPIKKKKKRKEKYQGALDDIDKCKAHGSVIRILKINNQ